VKLVLFDFDGTLTTKDSLNEFLKYSVGIKMYITKLIFFTPIFILYKLKLIKNDIAKQKLLSYFFKNWDEKKFKDIAKDFSLNHLDTILREDIYQKLLEYKENGNRIIVVSASLQCWLKPWCDRNEIELLATKLEFENHKVTGKFATKNCYGEEKVNRIKQYINFDNYEEIIAYGDSKGDNEMFSISTSHYKITNQWN